MKPISIFVYACLLLFSHNAFSSEAVGYYSAGSLSSSVSIDDFESTNVRKLFRPRQNLYGTKEIISSINGLADFMKKRYPSVEPTQVGDISAHKGKKIRRHKSHQNGLDADIVYYRVNETPQDENYQEWAENFVKSRKVTKNFHVQRNWEAMKYLVNNHDVGRIFVDSKIKKALCSYAKKVGEFEQETETLRRLRIEDSVHKNHLHLRIKCPSGNPRCKQQTEVPRGHGC